MRESLLIEVAAFVHGLLERIALPAENVVTVGGGATVFAFCQYHIFHCTMKEETRTRWTETHPRFMLYTNAGPDSGHMLLSAKLVTFHMSSYMICGSLTGCVEGQEPPPLAPEPPP